jgi:hypothetical protein
MERKIQESRSRTRAQAEDLLAAISTAETVIVATIERECEALRAGRMLAAQALHTRLCDAARLYLHATRAARASLWTLEQALPGSRARLDEGRAAFAAVLKVELSALAAERAVIGRDDAPTMAADAAPVAPRRQGDRRARAETPAVAPQLEVLSVPAPRRSAR